MNEATTAVGNNALVLGTPAVQEQDLGREVTVIEQKAQSVIVSSEAEYQMAGDLTRQVKQMQKKVEEYWEPLRVSAKQAYDSVLAHKKEMLEPLKVAEGILKGKMTDFLNELERKRREQEEAMRKLAEETVNRKLEEAAQAESAGDTAAAEFAMAQASVMESMAVAGGIQNQTPKANGVSKSKDWKITGIDSNLVPTVFNGVEIRPVDEKAVMRLIKASKGTIQIPGIQYEETARISVRR